MPAERMTALITGATGKLGRRFALGFSAMGWSVAFTTRGGDGGETLEAECLRMGAAQVARVLVDLTAEDAPERVARELVRRDMLPEVLVNNARDSTYLETVPGGRTSRASWQGELLLDVVVPYELTVNFAELAASPLRRVINVASIYGVAAPNLSLYTDPTRESPVNYGVAKAALIHLTKELAVRLAHRRISVNSVSYGGVAGRADDGFLARYARLCPAGRMLDDSEVFGAVKFLASSDASGMTGHNLVVDGGWTAW